MHHEELIRRQVNSPAQNTGPTLNTGPLNEEGPVNNAGPVPQTGPAGNVSIALRGTGPTLSAGPMPNAGPEREFSLLNSLPDVKGYMVWFHQVTDYLDRQLTPFEQCLYKQLYRLSWGFDQPTCIIGFPKLSERTNMSETAARQAAKGLVKKGLVKKRGMVFGKGVEQGIEWEVYAPPALLKYKEETKRRATRNAGLELNTGPAVNTGPLLVAPIKEINTQKEITQTQADVSVGSRFSLEECRRYANHLKQTGQGITNPGGYATKISRSGEADAFIEAFLNPPSPLDIGNCPACGGSNFVYIDANDPDRGVKPCRHIELRNQST
jgi:hypothetical protein